MTSEEMLDTILKTSFVKADLLRRVRIVREYTEQRFFASDGEKGRKELEEFLSSKEVSDDDKKTIIEYGQEFFRSFTKENAYHLLDGIEAGIKKVTTINLYVPIDLDVAGVHKLGDWMRENVNKTMLVELHVDTSVFGGCAFAREGVYHDFSLHHAFRSRSKEIGQIIDGFIKKVA